MIAVGIADDHAIARLGMRELLAECDEFCVVGEARDGGEALELVRRTKVDVLITDLAMPGQSGIDVLSGIRGAAPEVAVLVYTAYPQEQVAAAMFQFGAKGFVSKGGDPVELQGAVRALAVGRCHISPASAELVADRLSRRSLLPHSSLSVREFQVFLRLARGMTPGSIAPEMSLSPKTVSTYRSRVMQKLRLSSSSELTYYAVKHQLLNF